jgi:hypothetical protein
VEVLDSLDVLAPLVERAGESPRTADGRARYDGPACDEVIDGGPPACIRPDSSCIVRLTACSSGAVAGSSMGELSSRK